MRGLEAMSKLTLIVVMFSLVFSQQYQLVIQNPWCQQESANPSPLTDFIGNAGNGWKVFNATSDMRIKSSVSIAIRSGSFPYVSYSVSANPDLMNISYWNGNQWVEQTVNGSKFHKVSWPSSLAVDKNGYMHMAFYSGRVEPQKSAITYVSNKDGDWNAQNVEIGDLKNYFGYGSSLALDHNDRPKISYIGNGDIRLASWNGTSWNVEQVDSTFGVASPTSVALDKYGNPNIVYSHSTEKTDRYARLESGKWKVRLLEHHYRDSSIDVDSNGVPHIVSTGPGGLPLPGVYPLYYSKLLNGTWVSEALFPGYAQGREATVVLDKQGNPHIAYYSTDQTTNYAFWNGTNWTSERIEGPIRIRLKLALAFDSDGVPYVAYVDDDNKTVRVATKGDLGENQPPIADSGGDYQGAEGRYLSFNGTDSSDPEGGGLAFSWDFDNSVDSNGDGNFTNDEDATGQTPTHVYGDNGAYTVTLKVTDDVGKWDVDVCTATILNVAPTADADGPHEGNEPHTVQFTGTFTDPGTLDTHTFQWDFDFDGITFNVDSTEQNPTHQWLDDFNGTVAFKVTDDDGGWDLDVTHVTVNNLPPEATANGPYNSFEGTPIQFTGNHTDPGPLDTHTYEWDFSYDGTTFNSEATGNPYQKTWWDDHTGNIALRVTDDDGGWDLDVTTVTIVNVPPIANAGGDKEGYEVSTFTFNGSFYDPGSNDTHEFEWDFDYDGITFDVEATGKSTTHTWTDDFDGQIALRVTDDDGGADIDTAHVLVKNVAPTVTLGVLPIEVDAFLRMAGEKWHDVSIELFEDGVLIANGTLVRYPGSPNDQMLDLSNLQFDHSKNYAATVTYTPDDDSVNGQTNGANPCWIILRFSDAQELWIHHTFNVNHPETYVWEVDLTAEILSHGLIFEATAFDPGADELTFYWDFGDGTNAKSFYSNGNGTYPVQITEMINHAFPGSGTYVVVLTVEDDDGGVGVAMIAVTIP